MEFKKRISEYRRKSLPSYELTILDQYRIEKNPEERLRYYRILIEIDCEERKKREKEEREKREKEEMKFIYSIMNARYTSCK